MVQIRKVLPHRVALDKNGRIDEIRQKTNFNIDTYNTFNTRNTLLILKRKVLRTDLFTNLNVLGAVQ